MKRLFAIYVTLISLLGCALFLYTWPFSDVNVQNEWFCYCCLLGLPFCFVDIRYICRRMEMLLR
ncbi:hypothetical protein JS44_14735 [Anoxybacillus flavithermus]|uniref:Lipoprotein n=1 Tax=Anoxybacillus flavithermus TaxID=33934 RepID=A0A094J2E2_9BACL|nr:hypothetical protein JS44_14735 [Anoxybacillus flavithermus]